MGKKKKAVTRVVLDTNVLVSALLFRGELSEIVTLWKKGKVVPVISKETFNEFRNVLGYPKFSLSKSEIKTIIQEEILPFFEVVEITERVKGVCRDPDDDKFLSCALSGLVDFIVSGDEDLISLGRYKSIRIISIQEFLRIFSS